MNLRKYIFWFVDNFSRGLVGTHYKDIQLQLTGVEEWTIDAKGGLDLKFDAKMSRYYTPSAFQYINNQKVAVPIRFVKTEEGHLGYETLEGNKEDKALIITQ